MATELPAGVEVVALRQIEDERGAVLHMLRDDSPLFDRFGEAYFSIVNPGVVKAWKRHREMTQHFAVPVGRIRLVLFDDREESATRGRLSVFELGRPDRYLLVRIPPRLWYGFQGISDAPAMVANVTDMSHRPEESERVDPANSPIPFDWSRHAD